MTAAEDSDKWTPPNADRRADRRKSASTNQLHGLDMDVARLAVLLLTAVAFAGCTSTRTSNTARTSTEQLLISNAVDLALAKVDFSPFTGRAVFLESKYIDGVDKNYVVGSMRHQLLNSGAALVESREQAEVVVEIRSGAVGTTTSQSYVGTPELAIPGMITLPEVQLMTRTQQAGAAKLGIVAYDARTGQILGPGGMSVAESDDSNWFVAGIGPYRTGSLKDEMKRSTRGRAAWTQERLPAFVTFDAPQTPIEESSEIQFTSGVEESSAPPETAGSTAPWADR